MSKISCQITVSDVSTGTFKNVDQWDYVDDISKFPIPNKGDFVNFFNKEENRYIDYVVTEIKYAYKHNNAIFSSNTIIYISIYVKRI